MIECLNCGKELYNIDGKRGKKFCNSTCRSNFWQKCKRKNKENSLDKNLEEVNKLPNIQENIVKSKVMQEMEQRVAEIQKQFLNKK